MHGFIIIPAKNKEGFIVQELFDTGMIPEVDKYTETKLYPLGSRLFLNGKKYIYKKRVGATP